MTQEEKQLLLKDLCSRIPDGVQILYDSEKRFDGGLICQPLGLMKINKKTYITAYGVVDSIGLDEFKPYLRPMSSMTEEEYKEWRYLYLPLPHDNEATETQRRIDWLNAYHFDYRGLIEKGLALEAPEGMYTF